MNRIFYQFTFIFLSLLFICYGVFHPLFESAQSCTFDGNEMTIDYHIVVNMAQKDEEKVKEIIANTFQEIDRIYNKWNPNSEISRINRLEAYETISLSLQLEYFLRLTEKMVEQSEGRFDPTVEPLQKIWKDHLERGIIPSQERIDEILPAIGWKNIHFGKGKIFKDQSKTSLDFGGIAKGHCVDLIVEKIVAAGFNDVLVEWGGEIRVHGRQSVERPWSVMVSGLDEMDSRSVIAQMSLDNQSIATSGDYIQNWSIQQDGYEVVYFHIIDPRTAKPLESTSSSVASATVIAPTCLMADALAKAAIMHSSFSAAKEWVDEMNRRNPDIKFLLFSREEGSYSSF